MIRAEFSALPEAVDLLIIGGGVTGAGIAREAARLPITTLLLDAGDFAGGTSSMSSKLVHGGLRYLKTGEWRLTLESVRERQRLLAEAPGLVERLGFVMPLYERAKPSRGTMRVGLGLYDLMAGQRNAHSVTAQQALQRAPDLEDRGLIGAMCYDDARTDDARLVLRLLAEAQAEGLQLRNYTRVDRLLRNGERVSGAHVVDVESGAARELRARMVINATGAWADRLGGDAPQLRPLRGSHFLFPHWRFPLAQAVSWLHPDDHRPIFAYPWEGATLYGTTDLDQSPDADLHRLRMSEQEATYLMRGLQARFPRLNLQAKDALSQITGVRPIVAEAEGAPSSASRESAIWSEPGLVGITGGKLTTFRVAAREVLSRAAQQLPALMPAPDQAMFAVAGPVTSTAERRLVGRLGAALVSYREQMPAGEQCAIPGQPYQWAELRWALRYEAVVSLADLLLRRTRLGLVCAQGGVQHKAAIQALCTEELGWDEARWQAEWSAYKDYWLAYHAPLEAAA